MATTIFASAASGDASAESRSRTIRACSSSATSQDFRRAPAPTSASHSATASPREDQNRLVVIWDPIGNGRTVVRAAYARMIDQPVANVINLPSTNPPLATPLTFAGNIRLDNAQATALAGGLAPGSVGPDFQGAHLQSWNVNVERQVYTSLSVMAGYFGSKGTNLRIPRNINQFVNGVRPFPTVSSSSPILPGTPLGNITEVDALGVSHYKGLWLSATQRLSRGLQFDASYTLSKSTDYNSQSENIIRIQNSFDIAADWRHPITTRGTALSSTPSTSCRLAATPSSKAGRLAASSRHKPAIR